MRQNMGKGKNQKYKNKINKIINGGQQRQRKRKKGDRGNKDAGTIGTHGTIKK